MTLPYHQQEIFSNFLNENRLINIYIPDDNEALPVLYLLDGGINEQFLFIIKLVKQLIDDKQIEPCIVAGIQNTHRNFDLTNITTIDKDKKWVPEYGNSINFSNFLSEELIPYMDEHYKTSERKGIVGESLAGLFVMEILFHKPELFSHYIAIDPSLWWNNHKLMDEVINRFDFEILRNKKLWISTSRTVAIKMPTEQLMKLLHIKDIPLQNWHYLQDPHQTHFTIFKATIENALHWSFKKV